MIWHYRAGRTKNPDGSYYYQVIEWYRPDKECGAGWTNAITPGGDTKQQLIEDLEMMLEDVKKYKTFTLTAPTDNKAQLASEDSNADQ